MDEVIINETNSSVLQSEKSSKGNAQNFYKGRPKLFVNSNLYIYSKSVENVHSRSTLDVKN